LKNKQLLKNRLYPYFDESFYSYALRFAEGNGYRKPQTIYKLSKINFRWTNPSIIYIEDINNGELERSLSLELIKQCNFMIQTTREISNAYNVI
jgi:hypothetical protein